MERKTIYCDLDGVIADWEGRVLELYGMQNDKLIREYLKNGGKLENKLFNLRENIADMGYEFWSGIKPFSWAKQFCEELSLQGDFIFLTSSGNHNKRPKYAAGGAMGKLFWLNQNFNGLSAAISRDKHLHAHKNSTLIDDNKGNIEQFNKYGGHTYLFPHPYKIEDNEISINNIIEQIKYKIQLI
jgi:5'(3')-deoxyribonucleotidase